jgi:hypothetical protein
MAEASDRGGEPFASAWYSVERLMAEVHRADKAIAALRQIDNLIPNPDRASLQVVKRIIRKALADEC